jgi:hypothetical protein
MEQIENKINNLYKIEEWSKRLDEIKDIKIMIEEENENINDTLESLDENVKTKEYNINKVINEFSNSSLSKKIKYYHFLNTYINNMEKELFN